MVYPIFFLKFPVPGMLLEDFTACLRFEIEGNDALYIMEEVACTRYILTEKKSSGGYDDTGSATAGRPSSRCALRRSRYLRKMPGNGEGADFTGLPDKDSGRSSC